MAAIPRASRSTTLLGRRVLFPQRSRSHSRKPAVVQRERLALALLTTQSWLLLPARVVPTVLRDPSAHAQPCCYSDQPDNDAGRRTRRRGSATIPSAAVDAHPRDWRGTIPQQKAARAPARELLLKLRGYLLPKPPSHPRLHTANHSLPVPDQRSARTSLYQPGMQSSSPRGVAACFLHAVREEPQITSSKERRSETHDTTFRVRKIPDGLQGLERFAHP